MQVIDVRESDLLIWARKRPITIINKVRSLFHRITEVFLWSGIKIIWWFL